MGRPGACRSSSRRPSPTNWPAANVAAFFPALLLLAWRLGDSGVDRLALGRWRSSSCRRSRCWRWLVGTRACRAVQAWAVTLVALIRRRGDRGGGQELSRLPRRRAVDATHRLWSLSALTGHPLAVVCGLGRRHGLVSAAVGRRPALSFVIAVGAAVFGSPALYRPGAGGLCSRLGGPFVGVPTGGHQPGRDGACLRRRRCGRLSPT